MRALTLLMACMAASLSFASMAIAQTQPIVAERFGLFVVTDNLDRAAAFYERLFGTPQLRITGMIGFDVAGGLYAVVDRKHFAATTARGDTTRGYIKVLDIQTAYDIAAVIAPRDIEGGIISEGRFSFFRLCDPDRNLIEFYAISS